MLNITWRRRLNAITPAVSFYIFWESYSFEPDFKIWLFTLVERFPSLGNLFLGLFLAKEELKQCSGLLSGTWTSLGYGIEW